MLALHWEQAKSELIRSYWSFRRGGVGDPGNLTVQTFAGCQGRTMMEEVTDEQFTERWQEELSFYHFDAIDIDRYMMAHCPPGTGTREEATQFWTEYYKDKDYADMDEEKEKREQIEKSIKTSAYQQKFLNREFTVLKNEPKE